MQSPWSPFCAAVEALVEWESKAPVEEPVERLIARADRIGRLGAVLEDGQEDPIPLSELVRLRGLPGAEELALDLCVGRVLDVGAGSGAHTLLLQERGVSVTALDAQSALVAAQRARGVQDARQGDVMDGAWAQGRGERWGTLLFMMNGLGLCGDLSRLPQLLKASRELLTSGGVLLADGCDLRASGVLEEQHRIALREDSGRGFGEARMSMVFDPIDGERVEGEPFDWLYLDYENLAEVAAQDGWTCQCVYQSGAEYLARLSVP